MTRELGKIISVGCLFLKCNNYEVLNFLKEVCVLWFVIEIFIPCGQRILYFLQNYLV